MKSSNSLPMEYSKADIKNIFIYAVIFAGPQAIVMFDAIKEVLAMYLPSAWINLLMSITSIIAVAVKEYVANNTKQPN